MVFVGGILLIGLGILSLVAPDLMWSWQKFDNDLEGQASERTDAWEFRRIISGIGGLIVGGILIWIGIYTH